MNTDRSTRRRKHNWLVTLPLVAITVVYFLLFYRPAERAIADVNDELQIMRQSLVESATLPARLTHYRGELASTLDYIEQYRGASHCDVPRWFEAVSQAVKDSGARITQFNPEPATEHELLSEVQLRISCEGTFQHVLGAIRRIEQLPQTVWMEELKLERPTASAALRCEMRLALYCW